LTWKFALTFKKTSESTSIVDGVIATATIVTIVIADNLKYVVTVATVREGRDDASKEYTQISVGFIR
jgi:hypothetical protein